MESKSAVYCGNCHCGKYRYEFSLPETTQELTCDCGLCEKQGYLWLVPRPGTFNVVQDDGNLVEYQSLALKHGFCGLCGTGVLGQHLNGPLEGQLAVNVRSIHGTNPFNLKQSEEQSIVTSPNMSPIVPSSGSCHCGLVKVELLTPLQEMDLKEDNCSICVRNAWTGAYPTKSQVKLTGTERTQDYRFGRKFMGHPFCKTCGVHVYMNVYGPPQHVLNRLPEDKLKFVQKNLDLQPVNLRALDGVDLHSLPIKSSDVGTEGYDEVLSLTAAQGKKK